MFKSLIGGLRQAGRLWSLGLLLLIGSLLFSIPVVLPIFWLVFSSTRGTAMAQRMMAGDLDFLWFADLINQRFDGVGIETTSLLTIGGLLAIGLICYLMQTLFTAGIVSIIIANDREFRMWDFWAGSGAFFGRFFRLAVISKIFQGVALIGFLIWEAYLGRFGRTAESFGPVASRRIGGLIVLGLVLAFISMVFDYARLRTVANNRRRMLRESFRSLSFSLRHFFETFPLNLIITLVSGLLLGGLTLLRGRLPQTGGGGVLLAFLVGQLAIGLYLWCRIWLCAAQSEQLRLIVERHPRRQPRRRRGQSGRLNGTDQDGVGPAEPVAPESQQSADEPFDPYATRG